MYAYKKILLGAIVLALIALFTAGQAGAYGKSDTFHSGQRAGIDAVRMDGHLGTCSLGYVDTDDEAKSSVERHVAKLEQENKPSDFIEGFVKGYNDRYEMHANDNCTSK
ncbi:MAG: hypothetical protein MI802_27635 [Desulfobacterales bacterium]|nr:hypothetical protein [Desulfobacterales bacterium]